MRGLYWPSIHVKVCACARPLILLLVVAVSLLVAATEFGRVRQLERAGAARRLHARYSLAVHQDVLDRHERQAGPDMGKRLHGGPGGLSTRKRPPSSRGPGPARRTALQLPAGGRSAFRNSPGTASSSGTSSFTPQRKCPTTTSPGCPTATCS